MMINWKAELQKVAERYEQNGYEVVVDPLPEDIPAFLQGYRPDLLAYKGDEKVAVEIKAAGEALNEGVAFMAGIVNSQPGWRFDFGRCKQFALA